MNYIVDAYGGGGKINLNHVARFERRGLRYECFAANGDLLGEIASDEIQTPLAIVPETRGTTLISFSLDFKAGELSHERLPVIAWAIDAPDFVRPICCEDYVFDGFVWCLETEGTFRFSTGDYYGTLESATEYARRRLQLRAELRREEGQ